MGRRWWDRQRCYGSDNGERRDEQKKLRGRIRQTATEKIKERRRGAGLSGAIHRELGGIDGGSGLELWPVVSPVSAAQSVVVELLGRTRTIVQIIVDHPHGIGF